MNQPLKHSTAQTLRRGFSLVELIVVIGIIAILSGVMMATFGGGTASARAARCLTNMKNLAGACQTYGMATHRYPLAENLVYRDRSETRSGGDITVRIRHLETSGWISAFSKGMFPTTSYSKPASVSLYSSNDDEVKYALEHGVLFKYVSGNHDTYVCPDHARHMGPNVKVNWSYLMNARFGWNKADRAMPSNDSGRTEYGALAHADKILLFSEVPYMGFNSWQPSGEGSSTDTDAVLQFSEAGLDSKTSFSGGGSAEEIGVNHKSGKYYFAHVAFADGHTEKLRVPLNNKRPDTSGFAELTTWLCAGYDVSFDGKRYRRVK